MFRVLGTAIAIALLVLTAFAASVGATKVGDADQGGQSLTTELTGAAEVNAAGVPNQGDLDGVGSALITLNRGLGEICWEILVSDITLPASAAHIHVAPSTLPGPVVVPLSAPDATGFASGCRDVDRELVKAISKNPADYYVNVHNADFPAGALRGQLG